MPRIINGEIVPDDDPRAVQHRAPAWVPAVALLALLFAIISGRGHVGAGRNTTDIPAGLVSPTKQWAAIKGNSMFVRELTHQADAKGSLGKS